MKITDEDAAGRIARALRKRVNAYPRQTMVNDDVNVAMSFYRKDDPGTKCGEAHISGSLDMSLKDAALFSACGMVLLGILGGIRYAFRKLL